MNPTAEAAEAWNRPFFTVGPTAVTPALLALIVALAVATVAVSWLAQRIVGRTARRLGTAREGAVEAVQRLVHYVVLAVGLGMILDAVGIDLSTLFAAGAIFAIGLGFAMQNIAQNFVSGLILLLERSIKPGDLLEVEGTFVGCGRWGSAPPSPGLSTTRRSSSPTPRSCSPRSRTTRSRTRSAACGRRWESCTHPT
jgi:small-conductance mechanosensitive channel